MNLLPIFLALNRAISRDLRTCTLARAPGDVQTRAGDAISRAFQHILRGRIPDAERSASPSPTFDGGGGRAQRGRRASAKDVGEKTAQPLRKPCANCPWRKDAPTHYWDYDHFRRIWAECQGDGQTVMLCHKAKDSRAPDAPVCQGWIRVQQFDSVGVRIATLRGRVSIEEVRDVNTVDLYASFAEMMEANGFHVADDDDESARMERFRRWIRGEKPL